MPAPPKTPEPQTSARPRRRLRERFKVLILFLVLSFAYYPVALMLSISMKTNGQFVNNPWFFDSISQWNWGNWASGWKLVDQYIANSIFVATSHTVLLMVMAIVCSYATARYRFPGRNLFFYGLMATIFLPPSAASLITTFDLLSQLDMMNSLAALIFPGALGSQAMAVMILKQFIEDIPPDLFESAQMDGAGHFWQIKDIVIPLTGAILGVLSINTFLANWNDLMLPLIMIRDESKQTIPVGLMMLDGEYHKQWGQLMAGYSIAALPLVVIFIFTMRFFVKGFTSGAVKG